MKKLLALGAFLFLLVPVWGKTVVLYHTSDTHGFFYSQKDTGGFAALSSFVKQEKNPYLLLDSGDFANGTAETKKTKGLAAVELMNAVGYDAATIGNHEFDFTQEQVAPLLKKAKFAVLAANLRETKSGQIPSWAKAYAVFDVGGVKVAVIGLARRVTLPAEPLYSFAKPLAALESALVQAEKENPALVVVLAHDSWGDYKSGVQPYMGDIAQKYAGRVHVVLGGHAHKIFQNEFLKGVLYAESGSQLKNVTKITADIDDKTGKVRRVSSQLIALNTRQTGVDEAVAKLAESLREKEMDEVIGEAGADLSKNPVAKNEKDSPLDNLIADLGRQYTQTEIFIHNTGGTRISLDKGPVTKRLMVDVFPFEDKMVRFEVSGLTLKKFIRSGLVPWNKYAYAGLEISYTLTKKGRVKNLEVLVNGKPLENKKMYAVGTNSYVARQDLFKLAGKQQVGTQTVRGLVSAEFQKGPVFPPKTGRIILK